MVAATWLALGLAACGADGGPRSSLRLDAAADGSLRFERAALTAPAGGLSIEMRNASAIPHAIAIRGQGIDEAGQTAGTDGSSTVTADLRPGTYTLYCATGSHEQAGMTARLTVQ